MHSGERWRLGRSWWWLTACGASIAAIMWLFVDRGGLGVSYDSVVYASTRRILEAGGGWQFPTSLWPPGEPTILGLVGTGTGALLTNLVALVANLSLCYAITRAVGGRPLLAGMVTAWVALSAATVSVFSMMWSEPVFLVATNAALLAAVRIHQLRTVRTPWAAVLVSTVNVACVFRYAGVVLIGFAGLAVLVALFPRMRWRALLPAAYAVAGSSVALGLVAWSNLASGQPAMGSRGSAASTPLETVQQLLAIPAAFAINAPNVTWQFGTVVLLAGAPVAAWAVRSVGIRVLIEHRAALLLAWVALYVGFLAFSEATTYIDTLDYRLLAPVQVAGAVLVGMVSERAVRRLSRGAVVIGAGTVLGLTAVMLCGWIVANRSDIPSFASYQASLADVPALIDETVPPGAPIASNLPQRLGAITDRDLIVGFPDAGPRPADAPAYMPVFKRSAVRSGDFVVWFHGRGEPDPTWSLVERAPDVSVYRVR
jgi:hypothetical protein